KSLITNASSNGSVEIRHEAREIEGPTGGDSPGSSEPVSRRQNRAAGTGRDGVDSVEKPDEMQNNHQAKREEGCAGRCDGQTDTQRQFPWPASRVLGPAGFVVGIRQHRARRGCTPFTAVRALRVFVRLTERSPGLTG